MTNLYEDVLTEITTVQDLRGYTRPKNLSELEREPTDDDVYDISDAHCRVDLFLKKNRGLK